MSSFAQMHNDYLDPDRHLWPDEPPEGYYEMRAAFAEWYNYPWPAWEEDPEAITEEMEKGLVAWVQKRVFKYTNCGCCFDMGDTWVTVSGYVEGWDGDCPTHRLIWPFTEDEYFKALEEADAEGVEVWNDTHGCEECLKHWEAEGLAYDDSGFDMEYPGWVQVWKECPSCNGCGESI